MQARRQVSPVVERIENRVLFSGLPATAGATAMAYDPEGTLHVAYYDTASTELMYAAKAPDGTWSPALAIDAGPSAGSELSLALNAAGLPGVAYFDGTHRSLKFAHFDGSVWAVATVDAKGNAGHNPSLAFGTDDNPLISYYAAGPRDLRVATWTGSKWRTRTIDQQGNVGRFSSIAISPADGSWAVAYEATSSRQVRVVRSGGKSLARAILEKLPPASNWSSPPSVAFDAAGAPAVSYVDPATGSLKLAQASGAAGWTASAISSASGASGASGLSFDPKTGLPQILFVHGASLELATLAQGAWSVVALGEGSNPQPARDPSTNALAVILSTSGTTQLGSSMPAPTGVTATATSPVQIRVSWAIGAVQPGGFVIQRSVDGSAFSTVATVAGDVLSYDDPVTDGKTYAYRIAAFDATSTSGYTAAPAIHVLPPAPTGFTAGMSIDYAPWLDLSWTDVATGETGYRIERSIDGSPFSMIDILPADSATYTDATDTYDHTYTYRVVPFDATGDGSVSPARDVVMPPAAPTNVTALAINPGQVDLTWVNVTTHATHLELYAMSGTDTLSIDTDIDPSRTSYSVTQFADGTPLAPNTTYAFYVSAVGTATDYTGALGPATTPSVPASTTTGFGPPAPLEIDAYASDHLHLTWGDVLGESGYELQWSPDTTNFTTLATLGPDVTEYNATGLSENTLYYFRIRALNGSGPNSVYLWYAIGTTALPTPANLIATPLAGGAVQLTWSDLSSVETNYAIEVMQGAGPWSNRILLPAGSTSYVTTAGPSGPLQAGRTYRFRVLALVGDTGASDPTTSGSITVLG